MSELRLDLDRFEQAFDRPGDLDANTVADLLNALDLADDDLDAEQARLIADRARVRAFRRRLVEARSESTAQTAPGDRLLTRRQLAERLAVSERTLDKLARELPAPLRIGAAVRYSGRAVDQWIQRRTRRSDSNARDRPPGAGNGSHGDR